MTKEITGLIFGNEKKECKNEALKQVLVYSSSVELLKFRKVRNKDLFLYKFKINI